MKAPSAPLPGSLEERLLRVIEPVVRSEGLMLVEMVWRPQGRGQLLQLFVDRADGGIDLDECAAISRQVSDILDVEDFIKVRYTLEVGSPGLDRKLKHPREFELFAGRAARVVARGEDGGTRVLEGTLKGLMGPDVLIECEGRVESVPLDQVAKASLVPQL